VGSARTIPNGTLGIDHENGIDRQYVKQPFFRHYHQIQSIRIIILVQIGGYVCHAWLTIFW
jgi:hypothetical protein